MYALDLRMNEAPTERLAPLREADVARIWQAKHRYRRLYVEEPAARRIRRTRVRYRVAWDRVVLVFVVLASIATFRANAALEDQYRNDLRTTYAHVKS